MNLYVMREFEPLGGFYSASSVRELSPFADEIRLVSDFPEEVWDEGMATGFPLDNDGSSDTFWFEWFGRGVPIWTR